MLVTIDEMLIKQKKSIYLLSKQIECDFQNLQKLINNETSSISFKLLENICIALNCTPTEVLQIDNSLHNKRG